jgi:anti-sigma factor RsiW
MQSRHFSEADLLETYYTQPGESMPVMMHLADCEECASRYERLERKIRGSQTCHDEQPETFWTRQRLSIMRRVEMQKRRTLTMGQTLRIAAVAVFAFVLGGVATYRTLEPAATETVAIATAATPAITASTDTAVPADPWESEELDDFQSMVDWETWGDPKS